MLRWRLELLTVSSKIVTFSGIFTKDEAAARNSI